MPLYPNLGPRGYGVTIRSCKYLQETGGLEAESLRLNQNRSSNALYSKVSASYKITMRIAKFAVGTMMSLSCLTEAFAKNHCIYSQNCPRLLILGVRI
jgi:hypothetical protein